MMSPEWKKLEGTFFRHFKGNYYQLLYVAWHSETCQAQAVYRALYGEGEVWVRPLDMFLEEIERDGVRMRRFEPVRPENVPGEIRERARNAENAS